MRDGVVMPSGGATPWWMVSILGGVAIVLGLLLLVAPGATTVILVQVLGLYWLIAGLFSLVLALLERTGRARNVVAGLIGVVAGLLIVQHPLWSALVLPAMAIRLLGFAGLAIGALNLIGAVQARDWSLGLLGGVSLLFGLVILVGNTVLMGLSLPLAIGICALSGGVLLIIQGLRLR